MAWSASRLIRAGGGIQLQRLRGLLPIAVLASSTDIRAPSLGFSLHRDSLKLSGVKMINSSCVQSSPLAPTSPAPPASFSSQQRAAPRELPRPIVLEAENGQLLYSGLTSTELLTTLVNLNLVASETLVDLSIKVLKSPLYKVLPLERIVKRTIYHHFCAGENVREASAVLKRMWELGLRGILDYSLEDADSNDACDRNLQGFLETIYQVDALPPGSLSSACAKLTALAPLPLLERVSDVIRWQHMHQEFQLPWEQTGVPLLATESPTFHVRSAPEPLTPAEEEDLFAAQKRLWRLCEACQEQGLPLLVDAEYTSVQPAIDYLTVAAALHFNKAEVPLVYGTIQAYLKDALPRLSLAQAEFARRDIPFGVKLVRGAYLTRENSLAASLNAQSPIHSSIQDTHRCYDRCASFLLERVSAGEAHVVLATHNLESGKTSASKAEELGIDRRDSRLQFAQLKGMADGLSLALANAGFHVSKYLPFGPVGQVLPYLIRRAEENRGVLGNTRDERDRIRGELKRRLYVALGVV